MDLIKYDMTDIWAVAGDVVAPDGEKIRAGWGVEVVPRQWWNWFENRQDNNIAYMLQKGFPEWDATTQYIINKSYVQRNGIVYKATATSTNSDPINLTSWVRAFSDYSTASNALGALTPAADKLPYFNGASTAATTNLTAFARTILDDADDAAVRATISAQQSNTNLTSLSGVSAVANGLPYFTGTSGMAIATLTSFGRSLIDDADATQARLTLGLGTSATIDVTTGSLDTTTGRITRVGDYGENGGVPITQGSLVDANSLTISGTYVFPAGGVNLPTATSYYLKHTSYPTAGNAKQQAWAITLNTYFTRTQINGTWTGWTESFTTGNLALTSSNVDSTVGRVLKVGDFGVGSTGDGPAITNANSASVNGFYKLTSPYTNGPTADPYSITVTSYEDNVTQVAQLEGGTVPSTYVRKRSGASTWGNWYYVFGSNNTSSNVQTLLGAADYTAIRTQLGLSNKAEAGSNADITSLSGLTTALSVGQGGTGVTTSTGTGNNVLSNSPTFTGVPLAPTAAFGANSTQIATTAFVIANASSTPAGALMMFSGPVSNAPSGYLLANGSAVSRTTYSALFSAIGTTWGIGDGSTTFNLPDARGQFLRGLDNGRGVDPSRALGTTQASQNLLHTHTGTSDSAGGHTHAASSDTQGSHAHALPIQSTDNTAGFAAFKTTANITQTGSTDAAGAHAHNITVAAVAAHTHTFTSASSGGTEARPTNIAVNVYIKY